MQERPITPKFQSLWVYVRLKFSVGIRCTNLICECNVRARIIQNIQEALILDFRIIAAVNNHHFPHLSFAIRCFNTTCVLNDVGIKPVSLGSENLIAKAQRCVGVKEFGGDYFSKPMALLLEPIK